MVWTQFHNKSCFETHNTYFKHINFLYESRWRVGLVELMLEVRDYVSSVEEKRTLPKGELELSKRMYGLEIAFRLPIIEVKLWHHAVEKWWLWHLAKVQVSLKKNTKLGPKIIDFVFINYAICIVLVIDLWWLNKKYWYK